MPWAWLFLISSSPWLFSTATLIPSPAVQRRTHRRPVLCTASAAEASAAPPALCLSFDNEALRRLVVDPVPAGPPREVRGAHFVRVEPTPLDSPQLVAVSEESLALLGVDWDDAEDEPTAEAQRATFARYFSGNLVPAGAEPAAHCYCGHQFGTFAGQLGDGAAMYLGELVNGEGERWELQLKGAGLTPFSRTADGRKVLRSSIREFLCSEAMHHLGIPTTRAAALVTSDTRVLRDVLRNGNAKEEHCAVVARVARSFLRFGSFEVCLPAGPDGAPAGPSAGLEREILAPLVEYSVEVLFPSIHAAHSTAEARCAAMYAEVVGRTARLVAAWQSVGFVHGVLNTDNMALTGDTIDYGPFGFLDCYDEDCTPNTSDAVRRYSYANQPRACRFNLERLAEALAPLLPKDKASRALDTFWPAYEAERHDRFMRKLGLVVVREEGDAALLESLLSLMQATSADFTTTFRALSRIELPVSDEACVMTPQAFDPAREYILANCLSLRARLKRNRPNFHPRALARLREIAQTSPDQLASFGIDEYVVEREGARAAAYEELSTTSPRELRIADVRAWSDWLEVYRRRLLREREAAADASAAARQRVKIMNRANPRFVLRQHMAAKAIEKAERGDFGEIERLLQLLRRPYDDHGYLAAEAYAAPPPDWLQDTELT